jgi:hypothetical protein
MARQFLTQKMVFKKQKNLNVALKSTELLGKQLGLFVKKPVVGFQKRVPFSFKNVSDEELGIMIKDLEEDVIETKRLQTIIEEVTLENTKITQKKLDRIYKTKKDWFMDTNEALKLKVIDEVID